MKTLIQRFYDAIRSGEEAPVSIAEGGAVVRVTAEIWDALERNAVSASDSVTRMEVAQ
jgi:hypothetical protein